jgi:hypothetical protein
MNSSELTTAQRMVEYYSTNDFKGNYADCLKESFYYNRDVIINRIEEYFNLSNYETQKYLKNWFKIDSKQAQLIHDFIYENLEDFIDDFRGAYVGPTSLDSVSFGEQEEEINEDEKQQFEDAGFYVNDRNYAYYDLSYDGLHVDLLNDIQKLDNFLFTLKNAEVFQSFKEALISSESFDLKKYSETGFLLLHHPEAYFICENSEGFHYSTGLVSLYSYWPILNVIKRPGALKDNCFDVVYASGEFSRYIFKK